MLRDLSGTTEETIKTMFGAIIPVEKSRQVVIHIMYVKHFPELG